MQRLAELMKHLKVKIPLFLFFSVFDAIMRLCRIVYYATFLHVFHRIILDSANLVAMNATKKFEQLGSVFLLK